MSLPAPREMICRLLFAGVAVRELMKSWTSRSMAVVRAHVPSLSCQSVSPQCNAMLFMKHESYTNLYSSTEVLCQHVHQVP